MAEVPRSIERQASREQELQVPPFNNPFAPEETSPRPGDTQQDDNFEDLLPASFRGVGKKYKDIISTPKDSLDDFLNNEFNLTELDKMFHRLWIVGRPMPPRPLHYQLQSSRGIHVTEKMEQHLVWTKGRMYLKPIPRFLFEPGFWTRHFSCVKTQLSRPCRLTYRNLFEQPSSGDQKGQSDTTCQKCVLWKRALGFLHSYTALIAYECDFAIAQDKHLVPHDLKWPRWRIFVKELLGSRGIDIYSDIDRRFIYGELRLSRLNLLCLLQPPFKGYMSRWDQYSVFFEEHFTILTTSTVYMAIVLTAMQVGLATDMLKDNYAFQAASYGFTVFSILGPLCFVGIILVIFLYLFVTNFWSTLQYEKSRFDGIKRSSNQEGSGGANGLFGDV